MAGHWWPNERPSECIEMALAERLNDDYMTAMRAGDEVRRNTLRLLRAAIKNAEIEARGPLDDGGVLRVLQAQAKQRRDSIALFEQGGRSDLVASESAELAIIEGYLPIQLSDADIEAIAREHIAAAGATTAADIAKFMGPLMKALQGRADGRRVNEIVRRLLAG